MTGTERAENCPLFSLNSEKKVFCYGLNVFVPPENSYGDVLTPSVTGLGDGPLRRE